LEDLASIDTFLQRRLGGRYGHDAPGIIQSARPGELSPVDEHLGRLALWAELRWAARAEAVVHLEDLLLRRVRLGLLLPRGGLDRIKEIRAIAQPELGWDDQRWVEEETAYSRKWQECYGPPNHLVAGELLRAAPSRIEQGPRSANRELNQLAG
jgi:glycerol-3-phosphate dehydrogenase